MSCFADQLRNKNVGLAFAAGFFGFYHHAGVLMALEELQLRPTRVSGTSAGALVASMLASGLSATEIRDILLALKREDFWDMHWPLTRHGFGLLGGHLFRAELGRSLNVHTFESCEIPLVVGAYQLDRGRVVHLDRGPLIPAVYASCCYPYLFTPAEIDGKRYWDGGFGEKTPLTPFLGQPEVNAVLVSYLPMSRGGAPQEERKGLRAFLPSFTSLFADTPDVERRERDQISVNLLREAGKQVLVLAPERVWLGPFTLDKAAEAFEQARQGTLSILNSEDASLMGAATLF